MDIVSNILSGFFGVLFFVIKYGFFAIIFIIVWLIALTMFLNWYGKRLQRRLAKEEKWHTFHAVLKLAGGPEWLTKVVLPMLVKGKRIETHPSPEVYSFAGPEEMKLIANTEKFDLNSAGKFIYRAIPQPHGRRRPPGKNGGPIITSGGPYMPA